MGLEERAPQAALAAVARPATSRDVELFRVLAARQPVESELHGASMEPTIPGGARIRIRPIAPGGEPDSGQVIAFLAGTRVSCHRVVHVGRSGRARGYLITQGDGNWLCDPPVPLEAVAGFVPEYWRDGGWGEVGWPKPSLARRAVGFAPLVLLRALLALSPAAAIRLAGAISYLRMGLRSVWRG